MQYLANKLSFGFTSAKMDQFSPFNQVQSLSFSTSMILKIKEVVSSPIEGESLAVNLNTLLPLLLSYRPIP